MSALVQGRRFEILPSDVAIARRTIWTAADVAWARMELELPILMTETVLLAGQHIGLSCVVAIASVLRSDASFFPPGALKASGLLQRGETVDGMTLGDPGELQESFFPPGSLLPRQGIICRFHGHQMLTTQSNCCPMCERNQGDR